MRSGVKKIKFDYAYNDDKTIIIITIYSKTYGVKKAIIETKNYFKYNVGRYNWHIHFNNGNYYVESSIPYEDEDGKKKRHKTLKLHRLLMGVAETQLDMVVDHIDGNGLNMLENNLRLITKTENSKNKHFNKKDREINNYAKYTV